MMEWLRYTVRHGLHAVDGVYQRWHRLQRVGPLLFVGQVLYRGPPRQFPDGTEIGPGDVLGILHFNNARIAMLDAGTPAAIALGFARLLFESLRILGDLCVHDERFREIKVFQGLGWLRHGEQIGVINEPVEEGRRKRFLTAYIGLLVWAFAPRHGTAITARPEPTVTWLTRAALLRRFGGNSENGQTLRTTGVDARRA